MTGDNNDEETLHPPSQTTTIAAAAVPQTGPTLVQQVPTERHTRSVYTECWIIRGDELQVSVTVEYIENFAILRIY
jgi:hypothetical protein